MKQLWKDIEGYEGLYQVSNFGKIRSFDRVVDGNNGYVSFTRVIKGRIKKLYFNAKHNQSAVGLTKEKSKGEKSKTFDVARLVAKAFLPNPLNLPDVIQLDGDIFNCKVKNLQWMSEVDGVNYMIKITPSRNLTPNAKLNNNDVIKIRELYKSKLLKQREIAKIYDITESEIWRVINKYHFKNI